MRKAHQLAMKSGGHLEVVHDPQVAAMGADVLYTDVWTSMGQESEEAKRREIFKSFQLNDALLAKAKPQRRRAPLSSGPPRRRDHR